MTSIAVFGITAYFVYTDAPTPWVALGLTLTTICIALETREHIKGLQ